MYWIYLYSDTFIWLQEEKYLIYSASSYQYVMGECHGYLKTILTGLYDYNNLYCVSVEEKTAIEDPSVNTFMKSICDKKCGNYSVESANFMDRPLILPPLLNVQSEISRHKDKEKFDYVSYINHIDLFFGMQYQHDQLLSSLGAFSVSKPTINIIIGYVITRNEWDSVYELAKALTMRSYYVILTIPYESYVNSPQSTKKISSVIKSFYITSDYWTEGMMDVLLTMPLKEQINIKWRVTNKHSYNQIVKVLEGKEIRLPIRFDFEPSSDIDFFSQMVSFKKEDVLSRKLSKEDIFRHMVVNSNFFGQLKLKEDGTITSPCEEKTLSNIDVNDCWSKAIKKECERSNSEWFLTRDSRCENCRRCLLKYLCPSPSKLEILTGIITPCKNTNVFLHGEELS